MARLPRIAPMLATPGRLPPPSEDTSYAYEVKQDGQRCMVYAPGDGSVELRSRSGADITPAYPELASLGAVLGSRPAVLDGEIVALDDEGRSDFQRLQPRMGLAGSPVRAARMAAKAPVHLMLFDVVFLDTSRLTRTPYSERRAVLESLDLGGPAWSVPAAVVGHGRRALEMTRTAGFEGIVAKRRTSLYEPGARSRAWIKIRHVRTEDIVVGGWLPGHGRLTSPARRPPHGPPGPRRGTPLRRRRGHRLERRRTHHPRSPPPRRGDRHLSVHRAARGGRRPVGGAPAGRRGPLHDPHQGRTPAPALLAPPAARPHTR